MSDIATFRCGRCGAVAAVVHLLGPGEPDPRLGPDMDSGGQAADARLSIDGGPVSVTLGPVPADEAAIALASGDAGALFALDRELAPFWCPRCAASYCKEHFPAMATYDDGFFDAIVGICPDGHQRVLSD